MSRQQIQLGFPRIKTRSNLMVEECYEKKSCDYVDNLNPILKESIKRYTGEHYSDVHDLLRQNRFEETDSTTENIQVIKDIDEAFQNSPKTSKELTVYKAIDLNEFPKEIEETFISTSLDIRSLSGFSKSGDVIL